MKQIKLFGLLLAMSAMLMTSCEDDIIDTGGGGLDGDPTIALLEGTDVISSDAAVAANTEFTVRVSALAGDAELNTFEVIQDGALVDRSRFSIDGVQASTETVLLFGDDRNGFTYDVTITAHEEGVISAYAFEVTDAAGVSSQTSSIFIDTDATVTGGGEAPDVSVGGAASIDLDPNALYSINITANPLTGTLASIAVFEDDVLISDLSRLEFDNTDFTANPNPFTSEYTEGFADKSLLIRVQDSGSANYRVVIADSAGGTAEFVKTVNVGTVSSGTPVTSLLGILLNQAGPTGTGGLDLDNGSSTGSMDTAAEIADNGIDSSQPNSSNWRQTITAVNGASLRTLTPGANGLSEFFAFDDVAFIEDIAIFHNNNSEAYAGNVVLVGDLFTVFANGQYYLLEVTNVNATTTDNNDSYTFDIKK
jgi:hypothetical protein